jgi:hypothetical protein
MSCTNILFVAHCDCVFYARYNRAITTLEVAHEHYRAEYIAQVATEDDCCRGGNTHLLGCSGSCSATVTVAGRQKDRWGFPDGLVYFVCIV